MKLNRGRGRDTKKSFQISHRANEIKKLSSELPRSEGLRGHDPGKERTTKTNVLICQFLSSILEARAEKLSRRQLTAGWKANESYQYFSYSEETKIGVQGQPSWRDPGKYT